LSGIHFFRLNSRGFAALLAAQLMGAATAQAACPPNSRIAEWVLGGGLCQAVTTFGIETAGAEPVLVVVVHGDISDGGAATYHVAFAKTLARPGIVAVALTRPGYADDRGRVSEGSTYGRQDNYTRDTIAAVGGAIASLKTHYKPRRVIYVGHSGGGAIGGVLIGRSRGLIDGAVLVSCPCDIPRWLRERKQAVWTRSESPSNVAAYVARTTRVMVISGFEDTNTFPDQASGYVGMLQRRGIDASFALVEGAGHGLSGLATAAALAVETFAR
jgi:pimeloyl-ACP methyl ester carboxylesterase